MVVLGMVTQEMWSYSSLLAFVNAQSIVHKKNIKAIM